jgi:hypothetical protein
VTITKSITIDCTPNLGGVLAAGTNGININGAGAVVTLRGLDIEGSGTGLIGVNFISGSVLHLERSNVYGFQSGSAIGLRIGGDGTVFVSDTTFSDNGGGLTGGGIVSAPPTNGSVIVNRVQAYNNGRGIAASTTSHILIDHSSIAGGTIGVEADSGASVQISDTDVAFNNTAFSGVVTSYGTNRIAGNGSAGTPANAAGPASSAFGQE